MQYGNRKSTPRVVDGRVKKKNNHVPSANCYTAPHRGMVTVERKRPGAGYRHVVVVSDIVRFLRLLPNWDELGVGLNGVVLAPGEEYLDGYHTFGVVHLCAWTTDLWRDFGSKYYHAHREIFERLGVPCEKIDADRYRCAFDETSVRGYQLLHILLHELGHHHDRITTRRRICGGRGEGYAEAYALEHEAAIWDAYHRKFER